MFVSFYEIPIRERVDRVQHVLTDLHHFIQRLEHVFLRRVTVLQRFVGSAEVPLKNEHTERKNKRNRPRPD